VVKLSQPELGQDIKKRRLELGWTQSKLAEEAGTTQAHIANIELGTYNPKGSTIQSIYDAFNRQFVIKDKDYDFNEGLEALAQQILDAVHSLTKKLGF